ncbi:hypothetical protein OSB04_019378 [Centaurea solstitialis]|uniref:ENTH domain-containing protein n=1 Tax=Centaurea solstitialis TaxID=347529 RepID=A0AA38T2G9_9ASTR|nr:hypothetical protein OSB04_019378 [Centaurea solstitialis]
MRCGGTTLNCSNNSRFRGRNPEITLTTTKSKKGEKREIFGIPVRIARLWEIGSFSLVNRRIVAKFGQQLHEVEWLMSESLSMAQTMESGGSLVVKAWSPRVKIPGGPKFESQEQQTSSLWPWRFTCDDSGLLGLVGSQSGSNTQEQKMKLWRRASGALKDRTSLLKASLTVRSTLRNPDTEAAVIRATTHDESRVDYRSSQRVFAWVRISNHHLRLVLWAISDRMAKTRTWVVALKGLMLLHGIFCCKVPGIQQIGRLPFDLFNFNDKRRKHGNVSAFIRAYYVFLDQKSEFIFLHSQEQREPKEKSITQDLIWLQKLQDLLDTLLQVRPKSVETVNTLVLEAMECIVVEINDIFGLICSGIANVLMKVDSAEKIEAKMTFSILQKAKAQHEELLFYLAFCREIGAVNASESPKMEQIPEERVEELEHIIYGEPEESKTDESPKEEEKSIIVVEHRKSNKNHQTIITDDWELFDEEHKNRYQDIELIDLVSASAKNDDRLQHFVRKNVVEFPDLILL